MYFSKLLFYSSSIFGVLCFNANGKFSRCRLLYAIVLAIWRFLWFPIIPERQEGPYSTNMMSVLRILTQIGPAAILLSHSYKSFRHREIFEQVFEVLSRSYKISSTRTENCIFVLLTFLVTLTTVCMPNNNKLSNSYVNIIPSMAEALIILQFCSICQSTFQKRGPLLIERLNKRLGEHSTRLHVLKQANIIYGLQFLFVYVQLIGFIIFLCYRYIMYCWGGSQSCTSNHRFFIQTVMTLKCLLAFYLILCSEVTESQVCT